MFQEESDADNQLSVLNAQLNALKTCDQQPEPHSKNTDLQFSQQSDLDVQFNKHTLEQPIDCNNSNHLVQNGTGDIEPQHSGNLQDIQLFNDLEKEDVQQETSGQMSAVLCLKSLQDQEDLRSLLVSDPKPELSSRTVSQFEGQIQVSQEHGKETADDIYQEQRFIDTTENGNGSDVEERKGMQHFFDSQTFSSQIDKSLAFVQNTLDNSTILENEEERYSLEESCQHSNNMKQKNDLKTQKGDGVSTNGENSLDESAKETRVMNSDGLMALNSSGKDQQTVDGFSWNNAVFDNCNTNKMTSQNDRCNGESKDERLVCELLPKQDPEHNQQIQAQVSTYSLMHIVLSKVLECSYMMFTLTD